MILQIIDERKNKIIPKYVQREKNMNKYVQLIRRRRRQQAFVITKRRDKERRSSTYQQNVRKQQEHAVNVSIISLV